MTESNLVWWLHGWSEINGGVAPDARQWQIILDHLALVNRATASPQETQGPQRAAPQPTTRIETIPLNMTGLGGSIVIHSGISAVSYSEYLDARNANKVYVTISREPHWDAGATYSYYPYQSYPGKHIDENTRAVLTGHGVLARPDDIYLVVDNALKPTPTHYNHLHGSSNHLTMPAPNGVGILNVGNGSPFIC